MNFFIQRPIFAMSIALVMILAGAVCMLVLPIAQYPPRAAPGAGDHPVNRRRCRRGGRHGDHTPGREDQRGRGYDLHVFDQHQQRGFGDYGHLRCGF